MTKYYYKNPKDKELINNSFYAVAYLIFGLKNKKKIATFLEHFEKKVSQVNIFPQGTTTEYINGRTPGICRADNLGNIIVEMYGYEGASVNKYSFIKHEGIHEFCHAFVDLLSKIFAKYPNGIIKKGILCQNHLGLIKETNPQTGEFIGPHYYGKMYNETMMDIMTTIAINCYDSRNNGLTADSILNSNYQQWGGETTGYSIFTSITRLTIAAFSNNGFINYQDVINTGSSMIDIDTKMNNGETYKANDFLYGIVFDPLHIEMEFDKFMGEGAYRNHCELLDIIFHKSLKKQQIPGEHVKVIMKNLANFINKKINYYKSNGILSPEGANKIISNFNRIWNSMYSEYNAYFNGQEIAEIAKEAKKPKRT